MLMNPPTKRYERSNTARFGMTPYFTQTFAAVLGVTLISLFILAALFYFPPPTGEADARQIFWSTFQMGFSGIVGMLAGKGI